ncbi:MAG: DinB family protein [Chloroflexota bacterium]
MRLDDLRYLFAYDRWATRRILAVLDGVPEETWGATGAVGDRGLGSILVHQLGAHQRWRNGLAETGLTPRPEREPLPPAPALVAAWEPEWAALDAWLDTLDDAWPARTDEGIPFWQMLVHLANHGTQHRSEAATILTSAGRSPGDLDMIFFAEELARA